MDPLNWMQNSVYIITITCVCGILIIALIISFVISCCQRRKIRKLEKQLTEVEKNNSELTEEKAPIEGKEVIIIQESPASQVWESDECVFYDLGSISRGVSREVLDHIETVNAGPPIENTAVTQKKNSSSNNDEQETDYPEEMTTEFIEKDHIGILKNGSVKRTSQDNDCKLDSGGSCLEELTDGIWVGDDTKKRGSNEKLSINDALSDISETGAIMEDSGNETISNDDVLCPNVEEMTDEKAEEREEDRAEERAEEMADERAEEMAEDRADDRTEDRAETEENVEEMAKCDNNVREGEVVEDKEDEDDNNKEDIEQTEQILS